MAIPRELRARRGDFVLPYWRLLLDYIDRTNKVITGEGVRVSYLPSGGLSVYAEDNYNPWNSPFKVSAGSGTVVVREGTINGIAPSIDGVRISGIDDEGKAVDVPALKTVHLGGARSYVALKITLSEDAVEIDANNADALAVSHIAELPDLFTQGGTVSEGGVAFYPIAALYWTPNGKIRRAFQITHHNLGHRHVEGNLEKGLPSRQLFWAV